MIYQRRKEGTEEDWRDMAPDTVPSCMMPGHVYRIKPEPAAPKWPQTTMPEGLLVSKWYNGGPVNGPDEEISAMWRIVNAGIEYECSTGALVPADKVSEIEAKARAEGIKEGRDQEKNRDNLGSVHNRVGVQNGQTFSHQMSYPSSGGQLIGYKHGLTK